MIELIGHARYVIGKNPLTGFAFALLVLLLVCATAGPAIAPNDPLASNTALALRPPNVSNLLGTDQFGRDILSRIIVATRLDLWIDRTSMLLAAMKMTFPNEDTKLMVFENVVVNGPVDQKMFFVEKK